MELSKRGQSETHNSAHEPWMGWVSADPNLSHVHVITGEKWTCEVWCSHQNQDHSPPVQVP